MKLGDLFKVETHEWWCYITPQGTNSHTSIESLLQQRFRFRTMCLGVEEPIVFLAELLEEAYAHVLFLHPEHGVCLAYRLPVKYMEKVEE